MDIKTKILELLEDDGTISNKDIATMLDLSEKEVEKTINELKKNGVIKGYKAIVDWKKSGSKKAMAAIQVKVVPQEKAGFAKICTDIAKDKRVTDVFVATGEYDLMIFTEADDLDEISDFVTEKLAPKKEVVGTYTHIILTQFKRDGKLMAEEGQKRLPLTP